MTNQPTFKFPLRTLPLERFCEITGRTAESIRTMIHRATWAEGREYVKDPNGRINVILEGYDRWVESGAESKHAAAA